MFERISASTPSHSRLAPWALTSLALGVIAGCGGGGGGGSSAPTGGGATTGLTVEESLQRLGVNTADSARLDHTGAPLPADYSPLGKQYTLLPNTELIRLGVPSPQHDDPIRWIDPPRLHVNQNVAPLHSRGALDAPWAVETGSFVGIPQTKRAGAAAQLDDDAIQETVFVHAEGTALWLSTTQDMSAGFAESDWPLVTASAPIFDVAVAALDLDGDGTDELAVAWSSQVGEAQFAVFDEDSGGWFEITELSRTEFATLGGRLLIRIASGRLDFDASDELVLGITEYQAEGFGLPVRFEYAILDDMASGLATLNSGELKASLNGGVERTAILGAVATGDIDGDGLDEVLLAGQYEREPCQTVRYVLRAFDDASHGLADLGSTVAVTAFAGCINSERTIEYAHIGAADLMNDGACEVYVNNVLFDDWRAGPWQKRDEEISGWSAGGEQIFHNAKTTAMATGDFTGDGRDDIAVAGSSTWDIEIFSIIAGESTLTKTRDFFNAGPPGSSSAINVSLIPIDFDVDSTILEFVDYQYTMTEPIVMAVLAAAPGAEGIGQNTAACVTSYGNAESSSSGFEQEVSFSLSFIVGYNLESWGNGVEIEGKLTGEYGHTWNSTYTLETSLSYDTGPMEDTVVCTVVPIDYYTYRIVSDPDPTNIGQLMNLSLPRSAITLQVEREYYNDSVPNGSLRIAENVFTHRPGDIDSYPRAAKKNQLLAQWPGLQTPGVTSCGQGSGSTSQEIAVTQESGSSDFLNYAFEFEAKTKVGGVVLGLGFGAAGGSTWTRSVGEQTSYSGSVGAIDAAHFAQNAYQFGLFTYRQSDPTTNQQFDVINYWVE